jgi:alpha-1,2-mannosyltransferase
MPDELTLPPLRSWTGASAVRRAVAGGVLIASTVAWAIVIHLFLAHHPPYERYGALSDLGEHLGDLSILVHAGNPYVLRATLNDTTPPLTALLYAPFELVHGVARSVSVVGVDLVALSIALAAALRRAVRLELLDGMALASLVLAPITVLVLSQASYSTIFWGQDQLVGLALVVVDLLLIPPRHRGWLVGVAAGFLLTPIVFVVLLARVGLPAVARCVGAFLATAVVASFFNLHASRLYWFHLVPSGQASHRVFILGGRLASPAELGNSSLEGLLARHPFAHRIPLTPSWLVLAGLVGVLGTLVAWRCDARGEPVLAVCLLGLTAAACSPVAWDHHWVFATLLPVAAIEAWRTSRVLAVSCLAAVPLAFTREWSLLGTPSWPGVLEPVLHLSGPSLVAGGLLVVTLATQVAHTRRSRGPTDRVAA